MPSRKQLSLIRMIAWVMVVVLAGYYFYSQPAKPNLPSVQFTLRDTTGKAVSAADLTAKPKVVFFGFTRCPDVCPTGLTFLSTVLEDLGPAADNITPLFISVDSKHDTPAVVADYLSAFDKRIIGLTGDEAALAATKKSFSAYAKETENGFDHSASFYLLDREGRISETVAQADGLHAVTGKIKNLMER